VSDFFDLAIVGSGGAAFAAAIRAHQLGVSRIALVERGTVGGTCVNVGCVPSKTLLSAANTYWRGRHHPFAGIPHLEDPPDLEALIGQKQSLITEMRRSKYLDLIEEYGFTLIEGAARFVDEHTLAVDGAQLTATAFIIATGAEPAVPDLPGLDSVPYLTSTTAMSLTSLPRRLVVIGGSFVGMEQGQLFHHLGSEVTIVGRLAPWAEPELAHLLEESFGSEGLRVVRDKATSVARDGESITVTTSGGITVTGDALLVATGRRPRSADLDLHKAGVEVSQNGAISVDDEQRTTNPLVYAAGDVTGSPQFVYLAAAEGQVAAENAVTGAGSRVDRRALPSVVFTSPALASTGLTEAEATGAGYDVESRLLPLDKVPRAIVDHDTRGALKMVVEASTRRILGVHVLADHAGDVILAAVYAVKFGLTVNDLADTWAPYLTMGEALKLAAQSFDRDVAKLSCCSA
jgi:mercuric reductase